jgi:enoyl-CoA hydratase
MDTRIRYESRDSVAIITMDDGKVNALSSEMLDALNGALDRAERDGVVVVISGRPGVFSAGFDLPVLQASGPQAAKMVRAGFELAERVLSFPTPVLIGCTGHAVAMGAFLLLSGDYRIGVAGSYKLTANEVAIGLTMPQAAVEICRQRLSPAYFNRATTIAEVFSPDEAVAAGFLDRVVSEGAFSEARDGIAGELAKLDLASHAATKRRTRATAIGAIHEAIESDWAAYPAWQA